MYVGIVCKAQAGIYVSCMAEVCKLCQWYCARLGLGSFADIEHISVRFDFANSSHMLKHKLHNTECKYLIVSRHGVLPVRLILFNLSNIHFFVLTHVYSAIFM